MQNKTGLKRIVMAVVYSLKGLRAAFDTEAVFHQKFLNSSVEALIDGIGLAVHAPFGRAKNLGFPGSLVSLLLSVYVWVELVVMGVWLKPS